METEDFDYTPRISLYREPNLSSLYLPIPLLEDSF
jgi:hypothetical protein